MSFLGFRQSLQPNEEYNILFLGQTGAGKSTSINALANYIQFSSFEEAVAAPKFIQLIPTEFHLQHPNDENEVIPIKLGADQNEVCEVGKSCTQSPAEYIFEFNSKFSCTSKVRLIDSPGVGDTSGVAIDDLNFDKLMVYLGQFRKLHGICLVLKANEVRITTEFKYCLNELLMHLHKDACKNIMVCFTYSRSTSYQPGDGFITLKRYLESELSDVNLKLKSGENCFFIDNEAFRFLVAKKCGYPISDEQLQQCKQSWSKSVEKCAALLERIVQMPPHSLDFTVKLHQARRLIFRMAEPMVRLQDNIKENQVLIDKSVQQQQQQPLTQYIDPNERINERINLARELLNFKVNNLQFKPLDFPRTVCTNIKCIGVIELENGEKKIDYHTHCHSHCYLEGVPANVVAHPFLMLCQAMAFGYFDYCVAKCGCPWQLHMHIWFEYEKVAKKATETNAALQSITTVQQANLVIVEETAKLKAVSREYQMEHDTIQEIGIKFGHILSRNSTKSYNQFIEPYIDLLIREETRKMSDPNYSRVKYNSLVEMKEQYTKGVKAFQEALTGENGAQEELDVDDVDRLCNQLFELKRSGLLFKQILNGLPDEDCRSEFAFPPTKLCKFI